MAAASDSFEISKRSTGGDGSVTETIHIDGLRMKQLVEAIQTGSTKYGKDVPEVLHLKSELFAAPTSNGCSLSIKVLHTIFKSYPVRITGHEWLSCLLERTLPCDKCFGTKDQCGTIATDPSAWKRHMSRGLHAVKPADVATAAAAADSTHPVTLRQASLRDSFAVAKRGIERAKLQGFRQSAVACWLSANGIPPSLVEKILSPEFIELLAHDRGVPTRNTIRDTCHPQGVTYITRVIKALVKNNYFSVHVDGGSAKSGGGHAVAGVMLSSPAWEFDLYPPIPLMDHHEKALDIRVVVQGVLEQYEATIDQVAGLVGDNAAVMPAAARALELPFLNCLPHSLALCLEAALTTFPEARTFLQQVQAIIKAGGSLTRGAGFLTWGISKNALDFGETRWASLMAALVYLGGDQRSSDIARANKMLRVLAAVGGGGASAPSEEAAAAVADAGPARSVWGVLYDWIEATPTEKASKDAVLSFLCSAKYFGRVQALTQLLGDIDTTFASMQGSGAYDPDTDLVDHVNGIFARMSDAAADPSMLVPIAHDALEKRLTEAAAALKAEGNAVDATAVMESLATGKAEITADLVDWLPKSYHAFASKRSHTDKALERIRLRDRFALRSRPLPPPAGQATWAYLGVSAAVPAATKLKIGEEWVAVASLYDKDPPRGPFGPEGSTLPPARRHTYYWWQRHLRSFPVLGPHAMKMLAMAVGNGRLEGLFSLVKDSETDQRLMMGDKLLVNELYMRSNKPCVQGMMEAAVDFIPRVSLFPGKRARAEAAGAQAAGNSGAAVHSSAAAASVGVAGNWGGTRSAELGLQVAASMVGLGLGGREAASEGEAGAGGGAAGAGAGAGRPGSDEGEAVMGDGDF